MLNSSIIDTFLDFLVSITYYPPNDLLSIQIISRQYSCSMAYSLSLIQLQDCLWMTLEKAVQYGLENIMITYYKMVFRPAFDIPILPSRSTPVLLPAIPVQLTCPFLEIWDYSSTFSARCSSIYFRYSIFLTSCGCFLYHS